MQDGRYNYQLALEEFRRLRRRADLEQVTARIAGRSTLLLPFHEVRRLLRVDGNGERILQDIPLTAIVGSVGRYHDFDRNFLPLRDSDAQRWAHVAAAVESPLGVPPIEVYQIGESYFVTDGNHRVSVARRHGHQLISAYVTRLTSRITPNGDLTEQAVLLAAELTEFCERTGLDRLRPVERLRVTELGRAGELLHDCERFRSEQAPTSALAEAAIRWYDEDFAPVCDLIEQRGLLRDAPQRTVADLYLWLREHRDSLRRRLGWQLDDSAVADDLQRREPLIDQLLERWLPAALEPSTQSGSWRRDREFAPADWLFKTILVPLSGEAADWRALDQALVIAQAESATLFGLHVVSSAVEAQTPAAEQVCHTFHTRCAAVGIHADCTIEPGQAGRVIRERTRWCDLLVLPINHPPTASPLARLTSSLRTLIRGSACPVLALPGGAVPSVEHLLVGFDGSARAVEALVLAGYLAARWHRTLSVVATGEDNSSTAALLQEAAATVARYGISAQLFSGRGDPADAILIRAETIGADLIVLGGYGGRGVLDLVLGSVTEALLRTSRLPLLICQ